MKKTLIVLLPFFCLVLTSFYSHDSSITLEQALSEKKIEIEILPTGTYSGNSINIRLKNIDKNKLNLELPPGAIFIPANESEQTLVTDKEELLAINKGETKIFNIDAFCTEVHDHCPTTDSKFQMSKTSNEKLMKLIYFLDSTKTSDPGIIQQAIWCVTDNESVSDINTEDPGYSKSLRTFLCSLTKQKDTWYTTQREVSVNEQHEIVLVPQEIKGDISFESTEPVVLQGTVVDSTGKVLVKNPHQTTCPAGKIKFEFNLKIEGWAPGNYAVVYTNNGKEVLRQAFSF